MLQGWKTVSVRRAPSVWLHHVPMLGQSTSRIPAPLSATSKLSIPLSLTLTSGILRDQTHEQTIKRIHLTYDSRACVYTVLNQLFESAIKPKYYLSRVNAVNGITIDSCASQSK